jgi:predicted short-subunit dehydrogenase-like oxidoreductase (DUF2520 family)
MQVTVIGAGRVGRVLVSRLKKQGWDVVLLPARKKTLRARSDDELVVLATRDSALPELVAKLAKLGALGKKSAVVHVAGAFGPELLAPLAKRCAGVGQAHPLASIASHTRPPRLEGATLLLSGDPVAVRRGKRLAKALGMQGRSHRVKPALYHAAASLVANGSVAVVAAGEELLVRAGIPRRQARLLLGPLLATVADNVTTFGIPEALTGPVRRGDLVTIRAHLESAKTDPVVRRLYAFLVLQQLPLAARLGEAPKATLRNIQTLAKRAAEL